MTAAIVVENLLYLAGAVAAIVIGGVALTLRQRRPTSVEATMASFHAGLRALAPDDGAARSDPPLTVSLLSPQVDTDDPSGPTVGTRTPTEAGTV